MSAILPLAAMLLPGAFILLGGALAGDEALKGARS